MKKNVFLLGAVLLASCTMTYNSQHSEHGSTENVSTSIEQQIPPAMNLEDYAFKATTAASLLNDALVFQGPMARRQEMTQEEEALQVEKIDRYLGIMNQLLEVEPIQTLIEQSDREGYMFKMTVKMFGFDGSESSYVLYFNQEVDEVLTSSETSSEVIESSIIQESSIIEESSIEEQPSSIEEPQNLMMRDEEDEEDKEDEDEVCITVCVDDPTTVEVECDSPCEDIDEDYEEEENEFEEIQEDEVDEYEEHVGAEMGEVDDEGEEVILRGIIIINNQEYQMIGMKEIDGNETETKFFINLNENNWIKIEQETEGLENEYKIMMKTNGFVQKMKFEKELLDHGVKLSLFIQNEAGAPAMYKFYKEIDIETLDEYIRIEVREGGNKFKVKVYITIDELGNNVYTYKFDGSNHEHDRDGHRDYHDDDRDDNEDEDD